MTTTIQNEIERHVVIRPTVGLKYAIKIIQVITDRKKQVTYTLDNNL